MFHAKCCHAKCCHAKCCTFLEHNILHGGDCIEIFATQNVTSQDKQRQHLLSQRSSSISHVARVNDPWSTLHGNDLHARQHFAWRHNILHGDVTFCVAKISTQSPPCKKCNILRGNISHGDILHGTFCMAKIFYATCVSSRQLLRST